MSDYSIELKTLIDEFSLEVIYMPENGEKNRIHSADVNRPGLPIAGFLKYCDADRIECLGLAETGYLKDLPSEVRLSRFEELFALKIPALIITRNIEPFPELLDAAKQYEVPILRSAQSTSPLIAGLIGSLHVHLAPRITRHGVLVEVYGEGILLLGESGVGKSETAIELVKRGHRLIADDAVEIKRVSDKSLVGSAPEVIRHFIELRGIGIVDVRRLFGMGAIKISEKIDLVINLEAWDNKKVYDRLGLESQTTNILGIEVPSLVVPVKPGRNLAMIIEVAAMNYRQRMMGYNAAKELNDRVMKQFEKEGDPNAASFN
ncbi:MAG: HPr(Ser) kinase/phosphatase [Bacillota bacterium]|nr:HPr(Ser) kinase/phosphatase [Bacillota bacterium]